MKFIKNPILWILLFFIILWLAFVKALIFVLDSFIK